MFLKMPRIHPMHQIDFFVSVLPILLTTVKSQSSSSSASASPGLNNASSQDMVTAFKPSLGLVIGILSVMFITTFILIIYAKFCHRLTSISGPPFLGNEDEQVNIEQLARRPESQFSGIDKSVIESLPFFKFSSLKGSKDGLECVVCLSSFEDIEILRLLPKCKHAFHINCIDQWLEKHSSCPLCRVRVSVEDPEIIAYSSSLRLLWDQSEREHGRCDSNLELVVQREEDFVSGSNKFSIESSFSRPEKGQETSVDSHGKNNMHRFNHTINLSDAVFKTRWSNVNSSDLRLLNIETISAMLPETDDLKDINDEKRKFGNQGNYTDAVSSNSSLPSTSSNMKTDTTHLSKTTRQTEKRSMSEMTSVTRIDSLSTRNLFREDGVKEEKKRQLWLSIARRTIQGLANKEKRSALPLYTKDSLAL